MHGVYFRLRQLFRSSLCTSSFIYFFRFLHFSMSRGVFTLVVLVSSENIYAIVIRKVEHKIFLLIESPYQWLFFHGLLLHHCYNFSVVKWIHVLIYTYNNSTFLIIRYSSENCILLFNTTSTTSLSSKMLHLLLLLHNLVHLLPLLLLLIKLIIFI